MFVYNSLLEAHLSGNTAIPLNEYSERLMKMKKINKKTRRTYIEEEFKVKLLINTHNVKILIKLTRCFGKERQPILFFLQNKDKHKAAICLLLKYNE